MRMASSREPLGGTKVGRDRQHRVAAAVAQAAQDGGKVDVAFTQWAV